MSSMCPQDGSSETGEDVHRGPALRRHLCPHVHPSELAAHHCLGQSWLPPSSCIWRASCRPMASRGLAL